MRQLSSFLSLSATAILGANTLDASIFTFDSHRQSQHLKDSRLLEGAASPLLALRTKSHDGFVLEKTDQKTVQLLNQYGGMPSSLFGASGSDGNLRRSFIVLEGVTPEVGLSIEKDYSENLMVSSLPPMSSDDDPLAFLLEHSGAEDKYCAFQANNLATESERMNAAWECISRDPIFQEIPYATHKELLDQVESAESRGRKSSSTSSLRISFKDGSQLSKDALRSFFKDVSASSKDGKEVTVVLLPNVRTSGKSKRNTIPRSVAKKEAMARAVHSTSKRQSPEIVLASPPVCHSSNSSCSEATDNCSGHGFCDRKYGTKDDGAGSECYACKCQTTVEQKADGTTRIVRWGGPACQKEDISSPFWLIAGITVMIMAVAGTAVGMLFNVGQEELPGVISAGVGATRAQK